MKNKILIILVVLFVILAIIFVVVSLSKRQPEEASTDNDIILIWWNLFEPIENVQPLIDAYHKKNPKVMIQYVNKNVASYRQELDTVLSDDILINTPDIYTVHNTWSGKYEDYSLKATSTLFTEDELSDFYPIVKDDFYNKGLYGLPLYLDSLALIYDDTKFKVKGFDEPSALWSDFHVQAYELTERDSRKNIVRAGFSAFHPNNCQFSFDMINLLLLQNGVNILDSGGKKSQLDTQERAVGAFNFYKELGNGDMQVWDSNFKSDIAAFLEGDLIVYPAPSWRLINIINYNRVYNLNLDIKVAPIPQLAGTEEIYWPTYWGQMVSKETKHSKEAWEFIKFITESEQLKLLDQTIRGNGRPIGIIFPRLSMYELNSSDRYLGVYATSLKKAKSWKMRDGYEMKKVFDQALEENWEPKRIDTSINKVVSGSE